MEHPLRVTHNDSEYYFKLIKNSPVTTETSEFQIRVDENVTTILKTESGWIQKDNSLDIKPEIVNAIGNSLALRFRLS